MSYDLILLHRAYLEDISSDAALIARDRAEMALAEIPGLRRLSALKYLYEKVNPELHLEVGLAEAGEEGGLKSMVFRFSYDHSLASCLLHVEEAYRLAFDLAERLHLGVFDPQVGGFVSPDDLERACQQAQKKALQSQEYRAAHPPSHSQKRLWHRLKGLFGKR